ncbi:hypothetical protein N802_19100 [Knoellia sinensis KCTC 19936]|uniref:Uncharacterized protein n=1 Tax=Knoellia sinensis KCTC 19936 TaxID=1385520 RepID=A0A0A0J5D0_9MICO|nr:hypothetical protein [Knoellia sinensis]KGN31954.1 hypothetical protein N802_19100 [Knoellia sinensis KCTC 19936]
MVLTTEGERTAYKAFFVCRPRPLVATLARADDEFMSVALASPPKVNGLLLLWFVTGLACVLTVIGMFSIGIFVAPVALGLLALSVVLTSQSPGAWPAIAGLGLAAAVGLAWLGWIFATSGPAEMSCFGDSTGAEICTSNGRLVDPGAIEWGVAVWWFVASVATGVAAMVAYAVAASRTRSSVARLGK